jgi:hypothetical protein
MRRAEIDEAILSNVNTTWKKVALVVVKVANESGISFSDEEDDFEVIAQHIEFLVGEGLPLLIVFFSSLTTILPPRRINLPNREYWLAPERQADTLVYLRKHGTHFGVILVLFLCFVHWLVVRANAHNPPLFPESLLFIGMAAFLLSLIAWLGGFVAHFRRP